MTILNLKKSSIFSHTRLFVLVSIFLLLTTLYNVVVPLGRGSDEFGHFRYVRFITENHHVTRSLEEREQAGYVSHYPPLYYSTIAFLFFWVDTEETIFKRINYGQVPQNALIQEVLDVKWILQTAIMNFPYQGAILLWHLGRLFSSLLGAGAVIVAYFATLAIYPRCQSRALITAAIMAFMPLFALTTSTINNDNLITFFIAIYFYLMILLIKGSKNWLLFVALGLVLGLSLVTKFTVILVPLMMVLIFCFLAWYQRWPLISLIKRVGVVALTAAFITSGWFIFLIWNFNKIETEGIIAGTFVAIFPQVVSNVSGTEFLSTLSGGANPASTKSLAFGEWLIFFSRSFWGISSLSGFENLQIPFGVAVSLTILLILCLTVIGLIKAWFQQSKTQNIILVMLFAHFFAFLPLMLGRYYLNGQINETAQGRHLLMPTILVMSVLLMVGWTNWTQRREMQWTRPVLPALLLFASIFQLHTIYNMFPKPLPLVINQVAQPQLQVPLNSMLLDNTIEFKGYSINIPSNQSMLEATLVWQAHQPSSKDYLTQVQLLDQQGQVVSSWASHPANGLYPTRVWFPGEVVYNQIKLPLYNLNPGTYTLQAFLLEAYQNPPPKVTDPLFSTPVTLVEQPVHTPNFKTLAIPTKESIVNFKYHLWDFDFFTFSRPTYHYRAAIPVVWNVADESFPFSSIRLKLIGPNNQEFDPLTPPGNLRMFIVGADWPSGLYRLKAEVWQKNAIAGEALSPPLLEVDNQKRQFTSPPMAHKVDANFYNHLKLLGYDLPNPQVEPGGELDVFLHWQGLQTVNANLIVFNHLYDADNKLWASFDRILPPYYGGPIMWVPGQVVSDGYAIPIAPDVPDGIYYLRVGLFLGIGDDAWVPIPLTDNGQPTDITHVTVGPIKIGNPPANVLALDAQPQYVHNERLGDLVKLRGYDLNLSQETSELELTLYWENLAAIEKNYTTFVHLQNKQGQVVTQQDEPPADGKYPTSLWSVGEVIKDKVVISLPTNLTAGDYRLAVGMYDLSTGERLAVANTPDNAILLTSFNTVDILQ